MIEKTRSSLYEQDFQLWVEHTVSQLKTHDFDHLDLENLIEEVEALGRSERKEFGSPQICVTIVSYTNILREINHELSTRFIA